MAKEMSTGFVAVVGESLESTHYFTSEVDLPWHPQLGAVRVVQLGEDEVELGSELQPHIKRARIATRFIAIFPGRCLRAFQDDRNLDIDHTVMVQTQRPCLLGKGDLMLKVPRSGQLRHRICR